MSERDNQKLIAVSRISKLTTLNQREKMTNSFINSKSFYFPLIWMFISKGCNKRIDPFSTNVPLMDEPGSFRLLAKCLKNTCGRVVF